ncbi:phage Gp37/Gp68 family protein [Mesorhizobium sp. M1182]|uniref:DUF5131 family protein n=1 Tax=Mesorhizobium sp. M1182 TaxID=2957067 RepID=UPI00333B00B5
MADHSSIEWTDATWNPITGCAVKSPGCKRCYAMKLAGTRLKHHSSRAGLTIDTKNGPVWSGEVRFNEHWLDQPMRWSTPRMIFVCAHGDLFYEKVPLGWTMRVWDVMAQSWRHTLQVLTKRPDIMLEFCRRWADVNWEQDLDFKGARGPAEVRAAHTSGRGQLFADMLEAMGTPPPGCAYPLFDWAGGMSRWPDVFPHIWLGCSIEDQKHADERREPMRQLAEMGWLTWVSYEPALGPIDWTGWEFLRWIVSGGESGVDARPNHPAWHRATRDFAASNRIPYLFKQWGAFAPAGNFPELDPIDAVTVLPDGRVREWQPDFPHARLTDPRMVPMFNLGKKRAGRLLDGVEHSQFPEVAA